MDDLPLPVNKTQFDEQPIGNTSKIMIDQYPADFDPSKLQVKSEPLPLGKRLGSKVWKIKKEALQELLKIVEGENFRQFSEHEGVIVKSMSDSNVQCQLLSSRIIAKYLEKSDGYEGQSKIVMKNVIEKLMTVEKEEMQGIGMDILFWFMDHGSQEILINELNEYLLNKNPKIIGASLKVMQILVNNYGLKKLGNLEAFTRNLKLLAEAARPMAKPQTVELYKEIFKWMGEGLWGEFTIHAEVKEEVSKWAKTYEMQPMEIKRGLKKGEEGRKINPMEEQGDDDTPVDILPQYDSRWVDTVLEIKKWQDKKQHLDDFIKKTRVGCIVLRENSHYGTLLKRLFEDNNINLLQCGFKIVKNLCRGLKKGFSHTCKIFLSSVYLKLKDNKAMIADETLATLKTMTQSISLEDMQENIKAGLKDKSPQMRLNTLKLLRECSQKNEPKTTKILKSLLDTLIALTNDSASDVRDIALSVLCKIKEHHGMIFFEEKLESLPQKKINAIKAVKTLGGKEENSRMEIEEGSTNLNKSNSFSSLNNSKKPQEKTQTVPKDNKNSNAVKKNPTGPTPSINPSINTSKPSVKLAQGLEKKHISEKTFEQKSEVQMGPVRSFEEERKEWEEREMLEIRNQEWPIVPTPAHVLRLINLFSKLGEPFVSLATPFRLKGYHFNLIENCEHMFIIQNADLLLKWTLWRIQIEDISMIQKIASIILQCVFELKTSISDSQTLLVLSNLSSLLQTSFYNDKMMIVINSGLVELSDFHRQKVLNFWMSMVNEAASNPEFVDRILELVVLTFQNLQFASNELIMMARVEPLTKSKIFMGFLLAKYNKQYLMASGFKFNRTETAKDPWILKSTETDFALVMSVAERIFFMDIFKKINSQTIEEIRRLDSQCAKTQVIGLHLKIIDSVVLPYLNQSLHSLNVYSYFKFLANRVGELCDPLHGDPEVIVPYLRNFVRINIFFLLDLNESRIDNKDQLSKSVNKILLILLDTMSADHMLEIMSMLLNYSVKHNLSKRLNQLLMKCIMKTVKRDNFTSKAQKNIKFIFNFFIALIQEHKIENDEVIIKNLKFIFTELMAKFKELCVEVVLQKWNFYGGNFCSKEIQSLLRNFIGFINRKDVFEPQMQDHNNQINVQNPQNNYMNNQQSQMKDERIDKRRIENYQSMSNLPESATHLQIYPQKDQTQKQRVYASGTKIRETTNIHKNLQNKDISTQESIELVSTGNLVKNNEKERKKLQKLQNWNESLETLMTFNNARINEKNQSQNIPGVQQNNQPQQESQI